MNGRDRSLMVLTTALLYCLLCVSEGGLYSSKMLRHQDESRIVDIDAESRQYVKLKSSRHSRGRKRAPKIKRSDLMNTVHQTQAILQWTGENSEVVFILTNEPSSSEDAGGTLWRSTDYGGEYHSTASQFDEDATIKSYFVCQTNQLRIILVDTYNTSKRIWISEDKGYSYELITVPFSVDKIKFNPENCDWLLGYDKLQQVLYSSKTYGRKWTKLHDHVISGTEWSNQVGTTNIERFFWYVKGVDTDPLASSTVHFEYRNSDSMPDKSLLKSCYIPDCQETEFQKEYNSLGNIDKDSLTVQDEYIFVQKSGGVNKLYVSYKRGPFVKAKFPNYDGNAQSDFHVVSSDGGCAVIGVNHANGKSHLFFSNLEGDTYTRSLSNVRYYYRTVFGREVYTVDIHEVEGIVGTYICNVHKADGSRGYVTKITWDNGRSWSDIPTAYDTNGNRILGCNTCQLNLHISKTSTDFRYFMPPMLTRKSMPGLIIAQGSINDKLDDHPSRVAMFISNDDGKTWTLAKKHRHLVAVADHGAIIVAVTLVHLIPVTTLQFSSDYGRTWQTYTFTDSPFYIDAVLAQRDDGGSHYITLFAHKTYSVGWSIFRFDVSPLFKSKICRYPEDFENITLPVQMNNGTCVLGMRQQIERLKSDIHCMIDPSYKRFSSQTSCNCTEKDYECDFGYNYDQGLCQPIGSGSEDDSLPIPIPKCTYPKKNVSSGFRKIPGDKCEGELYDLLWKAEKCNATLITTGIPLCFMSSEVCRFFDIISESIRRVITQT